MKLQRRFNVDDYINHYDQVLLSAQKFGRVFVTSRNGTIILLVDHRREDVQAVA